MDHPPALDLRRNERMQGLSGNGARSGVRAGMATEGGDSLESSRRQQDPGGKGWWQVQALPGFHAQVRPRPEKWPPGPGTLQARAGERRNEGCLGDASWIHTCSSRAPLRDVPEDSMGQMLRRHTNSPSTWGYMSSRNSDSSWGTLAGCPNLSEIASIPTAEWGSSSPR